MMRDSCGQGGLWPTWGGVNLEGRHQGEPRAHWCHDLFSRFHSQFPAFLITCRLVLAPVIAEDAESLGRAPGLPGATPAAVLGLLSHCSLIALGGHKGALLGRRPRLGQDRNRPGVEAGVSPWTGPPQAWELIARAQVPVLPVLFQDQISTSPPWSQCPHRRRRLATLSPQSPEGTASRGGGRAVCTLSDEEFCSVPLCYSPDLSAPGLGLSGITAPLRRSVWLWMLPALPLVLTTRRSLWQHARA